MKHLCVWFVACSLVLWAAGARAAEVFVGQGAVPVANMPIGPGARATQILLSPAEAGAIPAGATITAIAFDKHDAHFTSSNQNEFRVYLRPSTATSLSGATTFGDAIAGATPVADAKFQDLGPERGYVQFSTDTAFIHDGKGLEIVIVWNDGRNVTFATGAPAWRHHAANEMVRASDPNDAPTAATPLVPFATRPNLRITYTSSGPHVSVRAAGAYAAPQQPFPFGGVVSFFGSGRVSLTVANEGDQPVVLGTPTFAANMGVTVTTVTAPPATLPVGGRAPFVFTVTGAPLSAAPEDVQVTLPTNDPRRSPLTWTQRLNRGAVPAAGEITLRVVRPQDRRIDLENNSTFALDEVDQGPAIPLQLAVANAGGSDLIVASAATAQCTPDCSLTVKTPLPSVIPAGSEVPLDLELSATTFGRRTLTVRIDSNDQDEATTQVMFTVDVLEPGLGAIKGRGLSGPLQEEWRDIPPRTVFDLGPRTPVAGTQAFLAEFWMTNTASSDFSRPLRLEMPRIENARGATVVVTSQPQSFAMSPSAPAWLVLGIIPSLGTWSFEVVWPTNDARLDPARFTVAGTTPNLPDLPDGGFHFPDGVLMTRDGGLPNPPPGGSSGGSEGGPTSEPAAGGASGSGDAGPDGGPDSGGSSAPSSDGCSCALGKRQAPSPALLPLALMAWWLRRRRP